MVSRLPGAARQRLFAWITATGTVVVCLALFLSYFAVRAYRDPFRRADILIEGDWMIDADEEIGFVGRKNGSTLRTELRTGGSAFHLFTDARRARVNAPGEQTPSQVDFLTIGCSFSWGHGIENSDTYTERLKGKLGATGANFALASYGSLNAVQMLERNLDLKPRVVIYGFIVPQLLRNLSPCAPSHAPYCLPVSYVSFDESGQPRAHSPHFEYFSPDLNRRYYQQVLMRKPGLTLDDVLWRMRIDLFRFTAARAISYPRDTRSQRKALGYALDRMVAATQRIGARLIVLYIPRLWRGVAEPPPRLLLNSIAGRDLTFVDLAPRVREYYRDPTNPDLTLPHDGHPSAAGHELIARELEGIVGPLLRNRR